MAALAGRLQLGGWRWVFLLLMAGGSLASYLAASYGLGTTTRLTDVIPWGLCLGLNVFCGIALAAGALTVASVASVIGGTEWRGIGRACLLIGSIGYLVAMLGMIANGPTDNNWRTLLQGWTQRSILSGAAWTVLLLALLLSIELVPQYSLRLARARWFAILQRLDLPLLILATILAVLHQFGLNRLIKLSETRFSPLWSGPSLALMFYLSSLSIAFAVLLFASWRSRLAFGKALPSSVLPTIARALTAAVFVYLVVRLMDLMERHLLLSMFSVTREGLLLLLEIVLLLVGMMWIKGSEEEPRELFFGAALIIAGVVANRLNTAITALEAGAGQDYLPRWGEFLISYSLIAAGVAGFALGVKHLSVFSEVEPLNELAG
jgi:Ni/Fe-hydrogenase subunit HybB-like protein